MVLLLIQLVTELQLLIQPILEHTPYPTGFGTHPSDPVMVVAHLHTPYPTGFGTPSPVPARFDTYSCRRLLS